MHARIDIKKTIRGTLPRVPFEKMLRMVFPTDYELSLVVCSDTLARSTNTKHRKKTYAANVLSFPLSKTEGEIFLNIPCAKREAKRYGVSERSRIALLFVHGLMHLKGYPHGRTMENEERRVLWAVGLQE